MRGKHNFGGSIKTGYTALNLNMDIQGTCAYTVTYEGGKGVSNYVHGTPFEVEGV
jgi:hypothetical protein